MEDVSEPKAQGRGRLLLILGVVAFLLVLLGIAIVVAPRTARSLLPSILCLLTPVVGFLVATWVWNRSAHDLAAMARGEMDSATRQETRIARRFGNVASVFGLLLISGVTLILVAGYVIFGPNPSGR